MKNLTENVMSKIPFNFTPIPTYFREHGWFDEVNCIIFVNWAFSRCSSTSRKVYFDHKEIFLEPFEFIFGRDSCSDEIGLTPQQVRTQVLHLVEAKMLVKSTIKTTSKFTVYRWVTNRFSENINQQNNQQSTSSQPAVNHNLEDNNTDHRSVDIDLFDARENAEFDLVFEHKKHGTVGIMRESLIFEMEGYNYVRDDIEKSISKMIKQNPIINGTIQAYLKPILEKTIKERKSCKEKTPIQQKIKSTKNKNFYLDQDLSESPLANFARRNGLK